MELLAIVWIVGLVAYFMLTNERQRENNLLIMWGLLVLSIFIYPLKLLLGL